MARLTTSLNGLPAAIQQDDGHTLSLGNQEQYLASYPHVVASSSSYSANPFPPSNMAAYSNADPLSAVKNIGVYAATTSSGNSTTDNPTINAAFREAIRKGMEKIMLTDFLPVLEAEWANITAAQGREFLDRFRQLESLASSTIKIYNRSLSMWLSWAKSHNVSIVPTDARVTEWLKDRLAQDEPIRWEGMVVAVVFLYKHFLLILFPGLESPKGPITIQFIQDLKSGKYKPGRFNSSTATGHGRGRRPASYSPIPSAQPQFSSADSSMEIDEPPQIPTPPASELGDQDDYRSQDMGFGKRPAPQIVTPASSPKLAPVDASELPVAPLPVPTPMNSNINFIKQTSFTSTEFGVVGNMFIKTENEFLEFRDIIHASSSLPRSKDYVLTCFYLLYPAKIVKAIDAAYDSITPEMVSALSFAVNDFVAKPWGTLGHYRPQWKQWCLYTTEQGISVVPTEDSMLAWLELYMISHPNASWRTLDTMTYAIAFLHTGIFSILFPELENPRTRSIREYIKSCRDIEHQEARNRAAATAAATSASTSSLNVPAV